MSGNTGSILTNDGTGVLSIIHTYSLQQPGRGISSGDLRGNGNLDLIVGNRDPITVEWGYSVLLGNGDGSFQSPVFYPQSDTKGINNYSHIVADFNNDHKPDAALAHEEANDSFAVLLGNGDGTFASPSYVFDGGNAPLASADFNKDGKIDLAVPGPSGGVFSSAMAMARSSRLPSIKVASVVVCLLQT